MFRCPDLSSNRSKFSEPWHVLFPWELFGEFAVFAFQTEDVPQTLQAEDPNAVVYGVLTVHCPEPDSYAHCETRIYRGTQKMEPNKINQTAKKKFRAQMSVALKLIRQAGPGEP